MEGASIIIESVKVFDQTAAKCFVDCMLVKNMVKVECEAKGKQPTIIILGKHLEPDSRYFYLWRTCI
jgi:hypothetical protein